MNDPDVILSVNGNARDRSQDPMVRHRLGPQRLDLEARRLNGIPSLSRHVGWSQTQPYIGRDEKGYYGRTNIIRITLHTVLLTRC